MKFKSEESHIRCSLFQRAIIGLNDEEVAINELKSEPAIVHDEVLPSQFLHCNGVHISIGSKVRSTVHVIQQFNLLVEDNNHRDRKIENVESLGTDGVGKNLHSVADNKRGERDIIRSIIQEHKRNESVRCPFRSGEGVLSETNSLADVEDKHANAGP